MSFQTLLNTLLPSTHEQFLPYLVLCHLHILENTGAALVGAQSVKGRVRIPLIGLGTTIVSAPAVSVRHRRVEDCIVTKITLSASANPSLEIHIQI